jgi:hypothetical protein
MSVSGPVRSSARLLLVAGLALAVPALPASAGAAPWVFGAPEDVTAAAGPRVFHHLESAGRRNLALSGGLAALVWEDNRDGVSRVYVSFRADRGGFGHERRVSGAEEAFEPSVAALPGGRFLVAWEEQGQVWLRVVGPGTAGPVTVAPGGPEAGQASLASAGEGRAVLAWSERSGRFRRVVVAELRVAGEAVAFPGAVCPVEDAPPVDDQLYPSPLVTGDGAVLVAWEDRRRGHTVIHRARARDLCGFTPPERLNEVREDRTVPYGRGSGAARVALDRFGADGVAAVWSDKRNFRTGYDVFSALSPDGGRTFGPNRPVQDDFGDLTEQWHPVVAGSSDGTLVALWDDSRDGTGDLWLAWHPGDAWSDNLAVPGASGPGEQGHPVVALDEAGDLHLAWVERDTLNGPTRLRYALARVASERAPLAGAGGGQGGESSRPVSPP